MLTPKQFQIFYCDTCRQKFPAIPEGNWKTAKHSCGSDGFWVYDNEKEFTKLWGWTHKHDNWKSDPQRQAILKRILAETGARQGLNLTVLTYRASAANLLIKTNEVDVNGRNEKGI